VPAAPTAAPIVPFAVRATSAFRPDLWPLSRPLPAHVDDHGPATLTRRDREVPELVAAKRRLLVADAAPWTAVAEDLDPTAALAAGRGLAAAVAAEQPATLAVQGDTVRLVDVGVEVGPDGAITTAPRTPGDDRDPDTARVTARSRAVPPWSRPLEATALAIAEDVVLVDRRARAVWLHVTAPSGWDPGGAGGAPLATLHGPIPAADRLRAASDALGRTIVGGGPHVRWTWGLTPDRTLARHARALPPAPPGPVEVAALTFRAERQTTLPLPALGLGVFLIRVHRAPLGDVISTPTRAAALADAVAAMPPDVAVYKGVADRREELLGWLHRRAGRAPAEVATG
jgi:hypothetical protein